MTKLCPIPDIPGWYVVVFALGVVAITNWQRGALHVETNKLGMCEFRSLLMERTMQELTDQVSEQARPWIKGMHLDSIGLCATLPDMVRLGVARWQDKEWIELVDCSSIQGCAQMTLRQAKRLAQERGLIPGVRLDK